MLYVIAGLLFGLLFWQACKQFGFTRLLAVRIAFPVVIFGIVFYPLVSFAQGGVPPTMFGMPIEMIVLIWLALVDFAKRVAEAVPGTREDKVIGVVDAITRKVVDFLAGRYGLPNDPSLIQKTPPSTS